jgi:hypothetical protein
MTTKTTKPKPKDLYVCVESFAGNDFAVAEGTRLRGDNPIVQRVPDRFAPPDTPDDELRQLKVALNPPPAQREPLGRVRLRVLPGSGPSTLAGGPTPQTVEQATRTGIRTYVSGDTFEAEGQDAQYLLDIGVCEVVESLPKKLAKAGQAIATGRTED